MNALIHDSRNIFRSINNYYLVFVTIYKNGINDSIAILYLLFACERLLQRLQEQ